MRRWTEEEDNLLQELREKLGSELTDRPQYPEVVGDRKLIRFIRGHFHKFDKVVEMVRNFLSWRKEEGIDAIRADIVDNKLDHPSKFPAGERILALNPMMVLNPECCDIDGDYICAEGVIPKQLWESGITEDEFIRFRIYCLEYVSMELEKRSDALETAFLANSNNEKTETDCGDASNSTGDDSSQKEVKPKEKKGWWGSSKNEDPVENTYGVLAKVNVLRDISGVSLLDFGSKNKGITQKMLKISGDNYPELLKKYFIVNSGLVFTGIWNIVRVFLAQRTLDKVAILGGGWKSEVNKTIPDSSIPAWLTGTVPTEAINTNIDVWDGLVDLPLPPAVASSQDEDQVTDAKLVSGAMPPQPGET